MMLACHAEVLLRSAGKRAGMESRRVRPAECCFFALQASPELVV